MSRKPQNAACFGTPPTGRVWLEIAGYHASRARAADPAKDFHNWLLVKGRVEFPTREWHFADPCLTIGELAALVTWLSDLPSAAATKIAFTEPLLGFTWTAGTGGSRLELRLRAEALPSSGFDQVTRWEDGLVIPWSPGPRELTAARDALQRQYEMLIRTGRASD